MKCSFAMLTIAALSVINFEFGEDTFGSIFRRDGKFTVFHGWDGQDFVVREHGACESADLLW